ncbi:helix-turn-helix domain-containing protein [Luteipulveratus halotolerans]|nr:helix-turn-helix domain-containing protein [Luteipulveratus halotolerans]
MVTTDDIVAAYERARVRAEASTLIERSLLRYAIAELREDGMSTRQIAARLRLPKSTVNRVRSTSKEQLAEELHWTTPDAYVEANNAAWPATPPMQIANAPFEVEATSPNTRRWRLLQFAGHDEQGRQRFSLDGRRAGPAGRA